MALAGRHCGLLWVGTRTKTVTEPNQKQEVNRGAWGAQHALYDLRVAT